MNSPFEFSNRDSGTKSTLELGIRHVSGSDFAVNVRLTYGRGETRGRYCGTAEFCAWRGLSLSTLVTGTDWHSKTTQKRGRVKGKGERKERERRDAHGEGQMEVGEFVEGADEGPDLSNIDSDNYH